MLKMVLILILIFYKKINIFETDKLENSSIHLVAQSGSLKSCELLYDKYFTTTEFDQIEVFSKTLNTFKMTPLHSASKVLTLKLQKLNFK